MSDIALRHSSLTYDFHKPMTVEALSRFDPELRLVLNRKYDCFQIHRHRTRWRTFWLDEHTRLVVQDEVLVHVHDWEEGTGLIGFDDPVPLLYHLISNDIIRHPRLEQERRDQVRDYWRRQQAKIRDNYRHATRSNMRQLMRAWAPLIHSPQFVR